MVMRRRVLRALMIVPLVLACVAGVARAEVFYNDTGTEYQGLVAGYEYGELGRHRATMEYLGFDWDSIGSVQQARLRTNSNGKNPYMAVYDLCQNIQYDWNGGVFDWPIFNVWAGIFGLSNMWYIGGLNTEDYAVAREYVLKVITGTGGGSGGSEQPQPDEGLDGWYSIELTANCLPYTGNAANSSVSVYGISSITLDDTTGKGTVNGTGQVVDSITYSGTKTLKLYIDPYSYNYIASNGYSVVSYVRSFGETYVVTQEGAFSYESINSDSNYGVRDLSGSANKGQVFTGASNKVYMYNDQVCVFLNKATKGRSYTIPANGINTSPLKPFWNNYNGDPNNPTTPTPDPPEPDPPSTDPTPPEQPTYVFEPVLGVDFPTITIEQDPVSDEIIDWLKLIHRDLSRISQEMNDYIEDASNAIVAAINNQGAALRRWFDTLSTQINDVYTYLVTMQERYLNELDRDLVTWLKRIYSRLGGNGAAEPDPNEDEKGFWDWILEQLQKFFVGNVDDAADGIKGLLQQLTEFFPFSLPWDLMALFGLFAAEPVTPVFDINLPVPAVIAADYGETLHIDLHQWDGTMNIVRDLETIFFAAWLISMVPTWLNDIKVGDM